MNHEAPGYTLLMPLDLETLDMRTIQHQREIIALKKVAIELAARLDEICRPQMAPNDTGHVDIGGNI